MGITGFSGGKLKGLAQHSLHTAVNDMGIVESLHQVVFHWLIDDLHRRFKEKVATVNGAKAQLKHMADLWLLGIEIGGTKLQVGLGRGDGSLEAIERLRVDPARGAPAILDQIKTAFDVLLKRSNLTPGEVGGVGVGFGGPVDVDAGCVQTSYQVARLDWLSARGLVAREPGNCRGGGPE